MEKVGRNCCENRTKIKHKKQTFWRKILRKSYFLKKKHFLIFVRFSLKKNSILKIFQGCRNFYRPRGTFRQHSLTLTKTFFFYKCFVFLFQLKIIRNDGGLLKGYKVPLSVKKNCQKFLQFSEISPKI